MSYNGSCKDEKHPQISGKYCSTVHHTLLIWNCCNDDRINSKQILNGEWDIRLLTMWIINFKVDDGDVIMFQYIYLYAYYIVTSSFYHHPLAHIRNIVNRHSFQSQAL